MPLTRDEANKLMAALREAIAPFVDTTPPLKPSKPAPLPGHTNGPLSDAEMARARGDK